MKPSIGAKILCLILLTLFYLPGTAFSEGEWAEQNGNIYNTTSGNVGIGTPSPRSKLQIDDATTDDNDILTLNQQSGYASGGRNFIRFTQGTDTPGLNARFGFDYDSYGIQFRNSNDDPTVTIKNNGNVGIGITNPGAKLVVRGPNTGSGLLRIHNTGPSTGDVNGIDFYHYTDEGIVANPKAYIRDEVLVNWGTKLHFGTSNNTGGTVVADTKMTIDDLGNVGIGTTTPGYALEVDGEIALFSGVGRRALEVGDAADRLLIGGGFNVQYFNGNVGIGTTNPISTLHVVTSGAPFTPDTASDDFVIGSSAATGISIQSGSVSSGRIVFAIDGQIERGGIVYDHANNRMRFDTNNIANQMVIDQDGKVGIGTTNPQSKLAVNGTITAKEVRVTETGWSDFVFEDTYELPSLISVESYIKKHKHLPDIPSAKEVEQQGLAISEMLAKQMQKIEEMTLYLIELKKENNLLKATIADQDKRLASLKELRARIEALEQRN